ncbi:MAG: YicC family protein [Opitutae bacterium]|nr:YicC family protein [Rhodospirillaceae bacterium]MBL61892.1 YicC family protein [Opitutae bacterium]|tara:strand:+ start:7555 stop:8433 length:879 start_codon:yes stop_codon:yes gene_type:complete
MKSMTGYGRGECVRDGCKVTVEITSVNRRQGEIGVHLPRDLDALEPRMREVIGGAVSRGRVNARVSVAFNGSTDGKAVIDVALAKRYLRDFRKLKKDLGLSSEVQMEHVLRAPGVLQVAEREVVAADYWPTVNAATERALKELVAMRSREGAALKKDLVKRVRLMRGAVAKVARRAPAVLKQYRKNLLGRVEEAGVDLSAMDDERVLREVVLFAERSDITEELTRLGSHFGQFDDCLKKREPVGRTLDFLSQEMNREINTIGSKANDPAISRLVVTLKTELEKFREQVQNVE